MAMTISNSDFILANYSSFELCTSYQKVAIWLSTLLES